MKSKREQQVENFQYKYSAREKKARKRGKKLFLDLQFESEMNKMQD